MSDNNTPRATGEPVAWALCDDAGVFDVEQDEATAHEWVRGGADCGLVRWLRPLVFGDVAHPDDLRSALTAALAASTRTAGVTPLDEWRVVREDGSNSPFYGWYCSRVEDARSVADELNVYHYEDAPHRVMRVCLREEPAASEVQP